MKETQDQRTLAYLRTHGCINPLDAWRKLGVYRLSAVIFRLREDHEIVTDRIKVTNQFDEECSVAEYRYMGVKDKAQLINV